MTPHALASLVIGLFMAFAIPGPCSYDAHTELDCADGQRCPDGLACAVDGHCKPEDVACDDLNEDLFPGGGIACDGVCVGRDTFQTDENNCGACGTVCDAGLGCCDGTCVATDVDERCGDCGVQCTADQTCFESACRASCVVDGDCPDAAAGEVCCDGLCSDGNVDERCGACDVACDVEDNETCVDQVCRTACSNDAECPESRCCDGLCVVPGDPAHCGACNESCGADTVCLDDTCAPECAGDRPCTGANEECCGGRCVDTTDDDDHCGGCDAPCAGTTFCNEGTCRTGRDRDCCGSGCESCGTEACINNQCVTCDIYEQNCGTDASCVPGFPLVPPAGRCIASLPDGATRFETCTSGGNTNTGCVEELSCQGVNDAQTCVRFCDFNAGNVNCEVGETCANIEFAPGLFVGVCTPPCDVATSLSCTWGSSPGTCLPPFSACATGGACVIAGSLGVGAACSAGECGPGLLCDTNIGVCVAMCRDVDSVCATGTCSNEFFCDEVGVCR